MKGELKKGDFLDSGFEILDVRYLDELNAPGIWAKHRKSGAEVYHVYNDDIENLFSFAFATPPRDSTGASHILEHIVLCGSESYPLKDTFLVLAQGSLQTFLNAWTSPDKTLYPASSVNEQDYFNLMAVYGDAVFRPLLSDWSFMQEGHRLFFDNDSGSLKISGVVYNEMKGAFSSLETHAGFWSIKSIMPDTPYAFESGGDPDSIPELTRDMLRDFHSLYYTPSNCRIFLAGNIPTEKQLDFLNEKFFSSLPPGTRAKPVGKTKPWEKPRSMLVPCPAGTESKPTIYLSWLCGDVLDVNETMGLFALTDILLGHDGSPLTKVLISSGLGEDLTPVSGLEANLRETSFCVGLRGAGKGAEERIENLITGELERLVREGIPKEEIEAALLGMEFSQREIRRSGGPFSLVWMRRSMRTWIHGGRPWDSLLVSPPFEELKRNLNKDPRYFEKMISRYFLDNPHKALVTIMPTEDFLSKKEDELQQKLSQKEASMSREEKEELNFKNSGLSLYMETDDSPEALASIPHLSRRDLSHDIEKTNREFTNASGLPMLIHPMFTNGISYVEMAFPVDVFPPEDYIWLPFFAKSVLAMGLPGMGYAELSSLIARTTGGFNVMLHTASPCPGSARTDTLPAGITDMTGRDWIVFRLKSLDEKFAPSLDLALRLISSADFSDIKRIRELLMEMKNEMDSSLAPSGHHFVSSRSSRLFSRARLIDDLWSGLDQILFAHDLMKMDIMEISLKLKYIQEKIRSAGVFVNYGGSNTDNAIKEIGDSLAVFGAPKPGNNLSADMDSFASLSKIKAASGGGIELFASPSLRIGFAGISHKTVPFGSELQSAELVFSHMLTTGLLWEEIRMKGGAYGASAHPDHLEGSFTFSTYRDPDPLKSFEAFSSIMKKYKEEEGRLMEEDSLVKAIIGCYSRETRPRSPAEKSITDFFRFLYGIEDNYREKRLKAIINVSAEEISAVQMRLANNTDPVYPVFLSGIKAAEEAAEKTGAGLHILPV